MASFFSLLLPPFPLSPSPVFLILPSSSLPPSLPLPIKSPLSSFSPRRRLSLPYSIHHWPFYLSLFSLASFIVQPFYSHSSHSPTPHSHLLFLSFLLSSLHLSYIILSSSSPSFSSSFLPPCLLSFLFSSLLYSQPSSVLLFHLFFVKQHPSPTQSLSSNPSLHKTISPLLT